MAPVGSNLLPPPPLHPANRALFEFLQSRGLHPYRLPVACEYERGSDRTQGFLDATGAKNDAASICLRPALEECGAELLDECNVTRIESTRGRVTALQCERRGRPLQLRGRVIVLAAGALATPCLLLRSSSRCWPYGLANSSGLVGRNLMRHFVDLYLVPATGGDPRVGNLKELAFNDWYTACGTGSRGLPLAARDDRANSHGGTVQSFGQLPPTSLLLDELQDELRQRRHGWLSALLRLGAPILRRAFERKFSARLVLATIQEDSPCAGNRVRLGVLGEAPVALEYRIGACDAARIAAFRARMRRLLAPLGVTLVKQAENNRRLAHVCGTCRAGDDPRSSVLDPHGRAHELENLYVADSSYFPTSGGTNPALTIAANALRVAEHLLDAGRARARIRSREAAACG